MATAMIMAARRAMMAFILTSAAFSHAYAQAKPPTDPAVIGIIHRLVLTDGNYQVVRRWEIKGDRVRYISAERNGVWEELPVSMVDWAATETFAHAHTADGREESAASADAKAVDAEEAAEKAEMNSRTPQVAPRLNLPDRDGVWVLDYFQNLPELVTLVQDSGDVNQQTGHNVLRSAIHPLASKKQEIRLDGEGSKVHLHENQPAFYVSLTTGDEMAAADALAVQARGATPVGAVSSPNSQYVIVTLEPRRGYRVVTSVSMSALGNMTQSQDVVPATTTVLPGGHWMKVVPEQPLTVGQYALMEMLNAKDVNLSVWDFAIDPQSGDNGNAILPIGR